MYTVRVTQKQKYIEILTICTDMDSITILSLLVHNDNTTRAGIVLLRE